MVRITRVLLGLCQAHTTQAIIPSTHLPDENNFPTIPTIPTIPGQPNPDDCRLATAGTGGDTSRELNMVGVEEGVKEREDC